MKYDFTTVIDRAGHDAVMVDGLGQEGYPGRPKEGFDAIPMWVADMNFFTCPAVSEAIIRRAQHPLYGYFDTPDAFFDAIVGWQKTRNGAEFIERKHIGYENSVIGGLKTALRALCSPGDKILLHSPAYTGFTRPLTNSGYRVVISPLKRDEEGIWRMDYADMEEKIVREQVRAAVICSPHNPTGRVWEREELEQAMEIFRRHDVYVVSDEIWADVILRGHRHIPTQSVSEDARSRTVALYSPTKGFNIAALVGAYHVVYNDWIRARMEKEASLTSYNEMNVMFLHSLLAAYSKEGADWLDGLRQVLSDNLDYAADYIRDHFPGVTAARAQGTYILYLDCTEWCAAHGKTLDQVLKAGWDVGVAWQDGRPFLGKCHIRMTLASPTSRIREAFDRLSRYVFNGEKLC